MLKQIESRRTLYMDLEMTCWEGAPPPGMWSEIIQIGIVEVDTETLKIGREAVYYVKPRHSTVDECCTALTGITQAKVQKQGRTFREVIATITKTFGFRSKACFTWGDDEAAIEVACAGSDVLSPFHMIDLGFLLRLEVGYHAAISLPKGLGVFGLEFEGAQHDALIDARNTARLHIAMLNRRRII